VSSATGGGTVHVSRRRMPGETTYGPHLDNDSGIASRILAAARLMRAHALCRWPHLPSSLSVVQCGQSGDCHT
jgi:hypothetical protein